MIDWPLVLSRYEARYGRGARALTNVWERVNVHKKPGAVRDQRFRLRVVLRRIRREQGDEDQF